MIPVGSDLKESFHFDPGGTDELSWVGPMTPAAKLIPEELLS